MKRIVLATFLLVTSMSSPAYSVVNPLGLARDLASSVYYGFCNALGYFMRSQLSPPVLGQDEEEVYFFEGDTQNRKTGTLVRAMLLHPMVVPVGLIEDPRPAFHRREDDRGVDRNPRRL